MLATMNCNSLVNCDVKSRPVTMTKKTVEGTVIWMFSLCFVEGIPQRVGGSSCVQWSDCFWSGFTRLPAADGGYTTRMRVSSSITVTSLISHLLSHFLLCFLLKSHISYLGSSFASSCIFLLSNFCHVLSAAYVLYIVLAASLTWCVDNEYTHKAMCVPLLYLEMLCPHA